MQESRLFILRFNRGEVVDALKGHFDDHVPVAAIPSDATLSVKGDVVVVEWTRVMASPFGEKRTGTAVVPYAMGGTA